MDSRIAFYDVGRGLGIILVVTGHVLDGLIVAGIAPKDGAEMTVTRFIYEFHMAVFFLLSGSLAAHSLRKTSRTFLAEKAATLLYPYFVWGSIQTTVQILASRYTNSPLSSDALWLLFYDPPMQFWFLIAMFLCQVVYLLADRLGGGVILLSIAALAGYWVSHQVLNRSPTGIGGRLADNLPFFALGAALAKTLPRLADLPIVALAILILAGFTINAVAASSPVAWPLQPLASLPGVFALLALSVLCLPFTGLVILGRFSLEIYLMHVLAYATVRIVLLKVFNVESVAVHVALGISTGVGVPFLIAWVSDRFRLRGLFRWPRSPAAQNPA